MSAVAPRHSKSQRSSPTSATSPLSDFHTVTCVAWSASGRNIGIGTPDGFIVYSTEPLVSTLSGSPLSPSGGNGNNNNGSGTGTDDGAGLQEVCRCAVYGGVGLLSLYKQCSVVAFTGVQHRSAAARVQLADISQAPPSAFYTTTTATGTTAGFPAIAVSRAARPWPEEEDAAVASWYEQWRGSAFANTSAPPSTVATPLAYVECPSTVAALQFCPHVVIAASSGDPNITGSHVLHIFDHRLQPLYTLPVFPPSSNAYLKDMIAIAATFTSSNGAGMTVRRLRVLLPGEKKGEVRLLTLKRSVLTATAYDSPAKATTNNTSTNMHAASYNSGDSHRLVDRVLHQAPLRAVAITEDGRSGVTMSNQGMRLRLLDFIGDDIISERLSLDRGRLPAVTDTVSLAIVPVPQPGSGGGGIGGHQRCGSDSGIATYAELPNRQYQLLTEALHDIVVCLTSSGTMHIFGCGRQQVLFYHSDKTLLPRVGYPYAFSLCLPSQLVKESGGVLFIARSDVESSAARYLPRREHCPAQRSGKGRSWVEKGNEGAASTVPGDFFAFQLRFPASASMSDACNGPINVGDGPHSSLFSRCSLAT
ncbi:hypothetical protein N2W54_001438 [Lotmaria passim]